MTVIEGESVTLECHISGYPSPTVTWYREDYQIESSIDFQITFQSGIARLMIREAFAEDSGRFTCSAVNEAGTVSTSCYLAVQGKCFPLPRYSCTYLLSTSSFRIRDYVRGPTELLLSKSL